MLPCRGEGSKRGRRHGKGPGLRRGFSVAGIPAVGASAPDQRVSAGPARQRQNSASRMMIGSGMPSNQSSAPLPKPMFSLLCFAGQKTPKPGGGSGRRRKVPCRFLRERKPRACVLGSSDLSGGRTPQADRRPRALAGVFFLEAASCRKTSRARSRRFPPRKARRKSLRSRTRTARRRTPPTGPEQSVALAARDCPSVVFPREPTSRAGIVQAGAAS